MTLQQWAEITGLTWADIAKMIPCSDPYPGMIARGTKPSWKMACRIEVISNGLVPRTNWYPDKIEPIGVDIQEE